MVQLDAQGGRLKRQSTPSLEGRGQWPRPPGMPSSTKLRRPLRGDHHLLKVVRDPGSGSCGGWCRNNRTTTKRQRGRRHRRSSWKRPSEGEGFALKFCVPGATKLGTQHTRECRACPRFADAHRQLTTGNRCTSTALDSTAQEAPLPLHEARLACASPLPSAHSIRARRQLI